MSLEQKLEENTAALQALIGLLAAQQSNAAPAKDAAATPARVTAAAKAAANKRPSEPVAEDPPEDPPQDEDDPFGDGADAGAGEPEPTIEEVTAKFKELRDEAISKLGKEEGMKLARAAVQKFAVKLDAMEPEKFADAIAYADSELAKLAKKKAK